MEMKCSPKSPRDPTGENPARERGQSRTTVLLVIALLLGVALGAFWVKHSADRANDKPEDQNAVRLSDGTKALLGRLEAPVEIRFYSILDRTTLAPAFFPFAEHVSRLLSEFERQANGRIQLAIYDSLTNSVAASAAADGIKPFNLEKGDACYLGLAVTCRDKREILTGLAPEWEPALEFDLSRAIERVARPNPPPKIAPELARNEAAAVEEVRRAIPNLAEVSVEDATSLLREAAMKDFKAALEEMGAQVRDAQQQVTQAQQSGSEADKQAAVKHLQQVQAEQSERIKQIAARLDAQLTALRQLKAK
jgi:hypothetical protein